MRSTSAVRYLLYYANEARNRPPTWSATMKHKSTDRAKDDASHADSRGRRRFLAATTAVAATLAGGLTDLWGDEGREPGVPMRPYGERSPFEKAARKSSRPGGKASCFQDGGNKTISIGFAHLLPRMFRQRRRRIPRGSRADPATNGRRDELQ